MERTSHDPVSVPASACWRCRDFVVEPGQRRLLRDGVEIKVEDRVLDLIVLLIRHRDRALDRREIIDTLWGPRPVSDATLRQLVHKARRTLDDDGEHQSVIRTLYGRSLQWVAPVETASMPTVATEPALRPTPVEAMREDPAAATPLPVDIPTSADPARAVLPVAAVPDRSRRMSHHSRWRSWPGLLMVLIVLLAAGASLLWWQHPAPRPSAAATRQAVIPADVTGAVTIAVLPFLDMDAGHDMPYLSDGLTEELINQLGRFPQLRVAARTSTFLFRDRPVDVREAARALGVANVLEGSVQRSGARIRVRVALVNAGNGYESWSDEYDAASGDLLNVEGEIAKAVITELRPKLDTRTLAALQTHSGINPAAHDFYLVGLEYLNRRTTPDIEKAIVYFQRAILSDPGYAPAWSGVAVAYAILRDYNSDAPPDTHYADALAAANKAIALDGQLASAHAVLGLLYEEHWEWTPAQREFKLALQLDPSDATTHQWYAMYLWFVGDVNTALAQMRSAHDLDPLSPIINADLGRALLYTGQVDAAVAQYRDAIALDPRFALTHLFLAQAYMAQNHDSEALQETQAAIALTPTPHPSSYLAVLGLAQSLTGNQGGAREQLATLESRSRTQYVSGVSLSLLYAQLGDDRKSLASLSRAVADHDHLMLPAVVSSADQWRNDARFAPLFVQMGLQKR